MVEAIIKALVVMAAQAVVLVMDSRLEVEHLVKGLLAAAAALVVAAAQVV
jgi:hypothetical protein